RSAAAGRRRVAEAALGERIKVLARVPFFAGLTGPALAAIATHLVEESYETGGIVVTIGEPGDRFYVVRSGRLEALGADGARLNELVPGEGFGELALIDRATRSATVRATEPTVLWWLDRGHFHRWVRDRYEVAARIRASADERTALAKLPFFRGVAGTELDRVAAKLRSRRVPAGQAVVRAGDAGDRYYVIREGSAQVTLPDGTPVRTLGPGDGFGELALLFGGPRTATVTATTELVVAGLMRDDFAALVRASGETMGEFRSRTAHYVGAGLGSAVGGT
ncbi:MAG: cyclic nucleotide-binding domain-containing protein, partial [Candidatus Limnocylindria bacterium]